MGILNLNDVPPPLGVSDTDNKDSDIGKVTPASLNPEAPANSAATTSPMFDTSALTDEPDAEPSTANVRACCANRG